MICVNHHGLNYLKAYYLAGFIRHFATMFDYSLLCQISLYISSSSLQWILLLVFCYQLVYTSFRLSSNPCGVVECILSYHTTGSGFESPGRKKKFQCSTYLVWYCHDMISTVGTQKEMLVIIPGILENSLNSLEKIDLLKWSGKNGLHITFYYEASWS